MSSDGSFRAAVVIAVGALVVASAAGLVFSMPSPIRQPLVFSHALHTEEVGAECTDCHLYAESGARATIPNVALCADCHDEALTDSEQEAWLVEQIRSATPIPWRKLNHVPDHVFFSHRRHTAVAEVECASCHGDMGSQAQPPGRPLLSISMDRCMACHDESGASNDCISCHR